MQRRLVGAGLMRREPVGVLFFVSAGGYQTLTSTVVAQLAGSAATGSKAPYTYKWTVNTKPVGSTVVFSDDTSLTSTATIDVDPGVYSLRLRATDANGRTSDSYVLITSALAPTSILGATLVEYWDSELGIALVSGAVDTWTGQKLGKVLQTPGSTQRPAYGADGISFNSRSVIKSRGGAGADNGLYLTSLPGLALTADATRPAVLAVGRFSTFDTSTGAHALVQALDSGGNGVRILYEGGVVGTNLRASFDGSTLNAARDAVAHLYELSANAVTGADLFVDGTSIANDPTHTGTAIAIDHFDTAGYLPATSNGACSLAALFVLSSPPSTTQRSALHVWSVGHFGSP